MPCLTIKARPAEISTMGRVLEDRYPTLRCIYRRSSVDIIMMQSDRKEAAGLAFILVSEVCGKSLFKKEQESTVEQVEMKHVGISPIPIPEPDGEYYL